MSSPRITTDDVAKVASLARLELTDDELSTFTEQLAAILDHADDLAALDLEGREALGSPHRLVNVLRPDEVGATLDRAEVLGSAPSADSGQFRVPSILGDGS